MEEKVWNVYNVMSDIASFRGGRLCRPTWESHSFTTTGQNVDTNSHPTNYQSYWNVIENYSLGYNVYLSGRKFGASMVYPIIGFRQAMDSTPAVGCGYFVTSVLQVWEDNRTITMRYSALNDGLVLTTGGPNFSYAHAVRAVHD